MSRSPFFRPQITGDPFWDTMGWPSDRFFDSHFGSNLTEDDFFPSYFLRRRQFGAPRSPLMAPPLAMPGQSAEGPHPLAAQVQQQTQSVPGGGQMVAPPTVSNDKYQIMVDVSHFTPEEISLKMVDNTIVVTGKHEDKADNYGYVSRQFSRKYLLPSDVEPETVSSTLSADGILSIQATRKPLQIKESDGRSVPIAISNQMLSPGLNITAPQFPSQPGPAPAPAPAPVQVSVPVPVQAPEPAQTAPATVQADFIPEGFIPNTESVPPPPPPPQ